MLESYRYPIRIGQDCLEPGLKQARIAAKSQPETIDDVLNEAIKNEENHRFRGILDPGQPLLD